MSRHLLAPTTAVAFLCVFFASVAMTQSNRFRPVVEQQPDVVIPAVIQIVLYGSDRFLAANVEAVRAAAAGPSSEVKTATYRLRAHRVVAQLNPCHEDNYWIGNATLSFGGADVAGTELLGRATQCRFWDEVPPFLLGFNASFFQHDINTARHALELAASRATKNAAGFQQMAIMLTVNSLKEATAALAMLESERNQARDPKLKDMLDRRVKRMRGLLSLRNAQNAYETRFRRKLEDPMDLVRFGFISEFKDPMGIGYVFKDGEFQLTRIEVAGAH